MGQRNIIVYIIIVDHCIYAFFSSSYYIPCLIVIEEDVAPGGDSSTGFWAGELVPGRGVTICKGVSCCGGGELAVVEPTEPGSLNPCVLLSSGVSKKHKLNSEPASNVTSVGLILSGDGALPKFPLRDWSILKTSIL